MPAAGAVAAARAKTADFHVCAESDAGIPPLGAQLCLTFAQGRIVNVGHGAIERQRIVPGVVDEAEVVRVREALDEVLSPDLRRVHTDLARNDVNDALDQVRGLRPAGAAVGIGRRAVGEDADAACIDRLPLVTPPTEKTRHHLESAEHTVVRADIEQLREFQSEQRAVAVGRNLDVEDLPAAVRCGLQALGAILDPLHGTFGDLRGSCGEVFLGIRPELRAEPTANVMADDPELRLGDTERPANEEPDEVRHLRRCPERAPGCRTGCSRQHSRASPSASGNSRC